MSEDKIAEKMRLAMVNAEIHPGITFQSLMIDLCMSIGQPWQETVWRQQTLAMAAAALNAYRDAMGDDGK